MTTKLAYDYSLSFETNGQRVKTRQSGKNIHEVIKKVRKAYPDAKMFILIKKIRILVK